MELQREVHYHGSHGSTILNIRIQVPVKSTSIEGVPQLFESNVVIEGDPNIIWSDVPRNVDSIEVLQMAFGSVRNFLDTLDGDVWWLTPGDNGGFPRMVIQAYGPEITRRQERALSAELNTIFAHVSEPKN